MFKCPYCNQDSYSKRKQKFESWKTVKAHTISCIKNNHEYYISEIYGPIYFTEFLNKTSKELRINYPKINQLSTIKSNFKIRGISINYYTNSWTKESILLAIQNFHKENNRIPQSRDFSTTIKYPCERTVRSKFDSWNNAIKLAGFEINSSKGFGNPTKAKDDVLYRSQAEAYFVNTFLYDKYKYMYEVPYNDGSKKLYDFYLPDLELYIELTGGLNPEVIQDKIQINKELNRKLLVITTQDMYKINYTLPL